MNPRKWRVFRTIGRDWWLVRDPDHVFLCSLGCRCVVVPDFEMAINYAQKEARR